MVLCIFHWALLKIRSVWEEDKQKRARAQRTLVKLALLSALKWRRNRLANLFWERLLSIIHWASLKIRLEWEEDQPKRARALLEVRSVWLWRDRMLANLENDTCVLQLFSWYKRFHTTIRTFTLIVTQWMERALSSQQLLDAAERVRAHSNTPQASCRTRAITDSWSTQHGTSRIT